ncbi:MAG TPA: outer membrane beta-barrel protein, partial [Bacteroidota bacterium]|nr:outer membrane beta-barrel protein [Bacteroidota bacterium]
LYELELHPVGHMPYAAMIEFADAEIDSGTVVLRTRTIQIPEVIVRAEAPIVQKGDTTEYLADSFRSSENATVEDLLQQLPGLRFAGGTIRAGTEEVSEILLNGLPISTSDPVTLLREIPAATIERVQVYERLSEDAEFSGFEDGETRTTINLVSRGGTRKMSSGTIAGGYGESSRYEIRASHSKVDGARRFMVSGNTQSSSGTGTFFVPMISVIDIPGSSSVGGFSLEERSPRTNTSYGASAAYNDAWEYGNYGLDYRFTRPSSESDVERERRYLTPDALGSVYRERRFTTSRQTSHTLRGRLQMAFDESNSVIFNPQVSFRSGETERTLDGENVSAMTGSSSRTATSKQTSTSSSGGGGKLTLRHRFELPGRTLSLELGYTGQGGERSTLLDSRNASHTLSGTREDTLRQSGRDDTPSEELSSRVVFTEPITVASRIQMEYRLTRSRSASSLRTTSRSSGGSEADSLDPSASSSFEQRYESHRAGGAFQMQSGKTLLTAGLAIERTSIEGNETFPLIRSSAQTYQTVLPSAWLKWNGGTKDLRIRYNAVAVIPSLVQVQEVVDNANPLFQAIGNPALRQGVRHRLNARYSFREAAGVWLFFSTSAEVIGNNICRSITVFDADTVLPNGVRLLRGGELTTYANMDGSWNARVSGEIAIPVALPGSRLSISAAASFSSTPWIRNGIEKLTRQWDIAPDITLFTRLDTTLNLHLTYAPSFRTSQISQDVAGPTRSIVHLLWLNCSWTVTRWLVLESQLWFRHEREGRTDLSRQGTLWDISVVLKPFGYRRGDIRLEVHDALNTDRGGGRTITETYVEDASAGLLHRYIMLRVLYFWN